ncbi:hypothetical protein BJG01_16715 [Vibrio splendidus]|nr:hypothetical protein BJG01_16715 [Vibrio splendidus]URM16094.1 hypothetical protein KLJ63_17215 [Vibrio splendidus]
MTTFQYYFHQLPCFDCKKTTVSTDLGWLTPAMKEGVIAQLTATLAQGEITPDLSANVVCTKEEAREYLLLNFFGYSEEELASEIEADDEKEVADEIAELLEEGEDTITFEHEIALQCCAGCDVVEDESN